MAGLMSKQGDVEMMHRDWRQLFFVVFWSLDKVILWNVLIGQVISISMNYYEDILQRKILAEQRQLDRELRKGSKDTYSEFNTSKQENSFRETPLCKLQPFLLTIQIEVRDL